MKKSIRTGINLFLLAILLSAASAFWLEAHAAAGAGSNGGQASESRPIDARVVQVVMSGPIDLILRPASTPELYVKGDPKLVTRVTTRIEGNTLYVATRGIYISIGQSEQTRVELSLPALEKVQLQGSGDGNIKGFKGARLELSQRGSGDLQADVDYQHVQASLTGSGDLQLQLAQSETVEIIAQGSGDATLRGQTRQMSAKLMGSGDLHAAAMKTAQLSIDLLGSADGRVYVSEELKARVSGSGDLHVQGNPARKQVQKTGSGEIYWR